DSPADVLSFDLGESLWVAAGEALYADAAEPHALGITPSTVRVDNNGDVWVTSESARKIRKIRGVQATQ
ncbi:MAG: hypothetical protein ACLGIN_03050, partial [Candidatus Sericytochromatia bacterium]